MNFDEFQEKIKNLSSINSATKIGQTIVVTLDGEQFATSKSEYETYESILERIKKKKEMAISKREKGIEEDFV